MPQDAYNAAIREAFACAPPSQRYLHTLILEHPAFEGHPLAVRRILPEYESWPLSTNNNSGGGYISWSVALVQDGEDHVFCGRLHNKCGFRFAMPARDTGGIQELSLAIDNTDESMSAFLESAKNHNAPCRVWYTVFMEGDNDTPQLDPPMLLFMRDAVVTPVEITATATFADIVNKKFPSILYTRRTFPSLND